MTRVGIRGAFEDECIVNIITVIVPCYNEREALPVFYAEISRVAEKMDDVNFEFLFINDGSTDDTLEIIKKMKDDDDRVAYVSFSRNFGKEAAMYAGMSNATGDYIATMDADLQDPPALLPEMYGAVTKEGYDCVATRRTNRIGEPPVRSFFSNLFYKLLNKISDTPVEPGVRDFRLMTRQMVDAILEMSEYNRFSKGIFSWVGFNTKYLEYENVQRVAGETKWSFWKLIPYSIDGIIGFSTFPLVISSIAGILFFLVALGLIVFIVVRQVVFGGSAYGWPSLVCIIFFIAGIQLFCIGILGQYLAKTYLETKKRPIYICKEKSVKGENTTAGIKNCNDKEEICD